MRWRHLVLAAAVGWLSASGAARAILILEKAPGAVPQGGYVVGYAFVVELSFLGGREKLLPVRVESVMTY